MQRRLAPLVVLVFGLLAGSGGCLLREPRDPIRDELSHYRALAKNTHFEDATNIADPAPWNSEGPRSLHRGSVPETWWNMSLEEAIEIAVTRSRVMRDLGATVIRAPNATTTVLEPSIEETDPTQGVYAALSAFDAQYESALLFQNNDRRLNNRFVAGRSDFKQDLLTFHQQLRKRSAFGTELALRQNIEYDANNGAANIFPSVWNTNVEASVRQPLLQGAGVEFNRIAGPGDTPGQLNGVLIARTRTDVRLTEFEMGLRDLVSNVENAYWDLYFAYRDLDSKVAARDAALEIWRRIAAANHAGLDAGRGYREAQAREQYYRFEEEVQNALSGRPGDGTATNNGTSGGTFRGLGGVLYSERRLRLILGLGINDDSLIRPTDEPVMVPVTFSWPEVSAEALARRPELRRQRIQVQRRELELVASRNYLLPQLDAVGLWRPRGFGDDLLLPHRDPADPYDSAFRNLTTGDYQEWQFGAELTFPLGFRRAHAGVRHAELQLARERALLDEQERQIIYDLSNAVAEIDRAYSVVQTAFNRRVAAKTNVELLRERSKWDPQFDLDQLLDAERRFADADVRYHRAAVEYVIAVKNVHYEKGSLLEYGQVYLSEQASNLVVPAPRAAAPEPLPSAPPDHGPPGPAPPNGGAAPPDNEIEARYLAPGPPASPAVFRE